jgi:hypothetical protein
MKDFRLAAQNVNVMSNFCTILKCKILMSDKFVSFIASYSLCIAVEAEGVPSDVLVVTERATTVLNMYLRN